MSLVSLEVANGVATLTLNHPEERNTLTAPMVAEIVAVMDRIEAEAGPTHLRDLTHPAG